MFIKMEYGIIDETISLLLCLSSDTSLLILVGNPNWLIAISKENVGIIIIYDPIALVGSSLLITILINIPKNFVINPPINNINVDLINIFFILKYML